MSGRVGGVELVGVGANSGMRRGVAVEEVDAGVIEGVVGVAEG